MANSVPITKEWTWIVSGPLTEVEYDHIDPLKRLQEVRLQGAPGSPLAAYEYIGGQRVQSMLLANGVSQEREYDLLGRSETSVAYLTAGLNLLDLEYVWDEAGNRKTRTNNKSTLAKNREFANDSAGQLTTSIRKNSSNVTESVIGYTLDGVGNRDVVTGGIGAGVYTQTTIDEQVNAYTTTPVGNIAHDDNGNKTSSTQVGQGTGQTFAYDSNNRLVRVADTSSGQSVRFLYGPLGRRVKKTVSVGGNAEQTKYRYLVSGALGQEEVSTVSTGAIVSVKEHVYGNSLMTPFLTIEKGVTPVAHYLLADDMNNVVAVSNSAGAVVEEFDYTDFGLPVDGANWLEKTGSTTGCNFLFAGKYYDWELGLYDSLARTYDPRVGRFLQRDPLGSWADSVNLGNGYTYAGNNPWSLSDPSGLSSLVATGPSLRPGMSRKQVAMAFLTPPPAKKPEPGPAAGGVCGTSCQERPGEQEHGEKKKECPDGNGGGSGAAPSGDWLDHLEEGFVDEFKRAFSAAAARGDKPAVDALKALLVEYKAMRDSLDMTSLADRTTFASIALGAMMEALRYADSNWADVTTVGPSAWGQLVSDFNASQAEAPFWGITFTDVAIGVGAGVGVGATLLIGGPLLVGAARWGLSRWGTNAAVAATGTVAAGKGLAGNPMFRRAIEVTSKNGLSPAGSALTKHPNIVGHTTDVAMRAAHGGSATVLNGLASTALKEIMRVHVTVDRGLVLSYYLPSGLGARFEIMTNVMVGFLGRNVR